MRLAIIGPGALGTMLAINLAEGGGLDIWLIDRDSDRAAALAVAPLVLELAEQRSLKSDKIRVTASPAGPFSFIILAVKSADVAAGLAAAVPLSGPDTMVISMVNGLDHLEQMRAWPGPGLAAAGVTAMGATLLSPGRVRFGGAGLTRFGLVGQVTPAGRKNLRQLAEIFSRAKMAARTCDDIAQEIWNKLLVNVGINGLTAIHDCRNGELADDPDLAVQLAAAVREAARVGEGLGFSFTEDPVARAIEVCRATADNISSMLQDIRKGKKTEIMAINGAVVRLGKELGIKTPVNRRIMDRVLALGG